MEVLHDGDGNYTIQGNVLYPAFHHNNSLIHLIIKGSFSKIPKFCFTKCEELQTVNIGDNIITIDDYAFYSCTRLNKVVFPQTIKSIGKHSFNHTNVKDIDFIENLEIMYDSYFDQSKLFCKCKIEKLKYLDHDCIGYANYTIPSCVTVVKSQAFLNSNITGIVIPENVEFIEDKAFENCVNLSSVVINAKNISFGSWVFEGCKKLTSIDIPEGVKRFGPNCFRHIKNINYLGDHNKLIPGAYSGWNGRSVNIPTDVDKIPDYAFFDCSFNELTIPNSIKIIGSHAFAFCNLYMPLIIPNTIEIIESRAFRGFHSRIIINSAKKICEEGFYSSSISNIVYDNSIDKIDKNTFYNCYNLISIIFPDNLKEIGSSAFQYCRALKNMTFPDNFEKIGSYAFYGCDGLTSIIFPDSLKEIGSHAFGSCHRLLNITLPYNLKKIGSHAFGGCSGLTSIIFPDNLKEIGPFAFGSCYGLTSIIFPDNLKEIGPDIFSDCPRLINITFPDNLEKIGSYAFFGCNNLTRITFPNSLKEIGSSAFNACYRLVNITLPKSLKEIGYDAFDDIPELDELEIPKFVRKIRSNGIKSKKYILKGYDYQFDVIRNISKYSYDINQVPDDIIPYFKYYKKQFNSLEFTIPKNIKKICSGAFYGCNLKTINFSNVEEIGSLAFAECRNLQNVYLPVNLKKIEDKAFYNCTNLMNIELPLNLEYLGDGDFSKTKIARLIIPDSVYYYGNFYFYYFAQFNYIKFPSTNMLFEIDEEQIDNPFRDYMFDFLDDPTISKTIVLPEELEKIGNFAFAGLNFIKSLVIPKKVKQIGDFAFSNCARLTYLRILGEVQFFGRRCFENTNLREITIPNSATLSHDAFIGCNNLQRITFGDINFSVYTHSVIADEYEYHLMLVREMLYRRHIHINIDKKVQHYLSYNEPMLNNKIEFHYIGNSKNDSDVDILFYDFVRKYAKSVYVDDSYQKQTFCTKKVTLHRESAIPQSFDLNHKTRFQYISNGCALLYAISSEKDLI